MNGYMFCGGVVSHTLVTQMVDLCCQHHHERCVDVREYAGAGSQFVSHVQAKCFDERLLLF